MASVACLRATAVADSTLGGSASVTLSAGLFTSTDKGVVAPATTSGACNPAAAVAAITGYFSAAAAVGASLGLDGIVVMVAVAYSCDAAFIGVGIRRVVARGCCSGGEPQQHGNRDEQVEFHNTMDLEVRLIHVAGDPLDGRAEFRHARE